MGESDTDREQREEIQKESVAKIKCEPQSGDDIYCLLLRMTPARLTGKVSTFDPYFFNLSVISWSF